MVNKLILNKETYIEDDIKQAYNLKTGEIDWNCLCLKTYMNNACTKKFKEAFTCYIKDKKDCKSKIISYMSCFTKLNKN